MNNKPLNVAVFEFDIPTETIAVEAPANSQSAQGVGANKVTETSEAFRVDWLVHLVHNSVRNRAIAMIIEYMSLTKSLGEISALKVMTKYKSEQASEGSNKKKQRERERERERQRERDRETNRKRDRDAI